MCFLIFTSLDMSSILQTQVLRHLANEMREEEGGETIGSLCIVSSDDVKELLAQVRSFAPLLWTLCHSIPVLMYISHRAFEAGFLLLTLTCTVFSCFTYMYRHAVKTRFIGVLFSRAASQRPSDEETCMFFCTYFAGSCGGGRRRSRSCKRRSV